MILLIPLTEFGSKTLWLLQPCLDASHGSGLCTKWWSHVSTSQCSCILEL